MVAPYCHGLQRPTTTTPKLTWNHVFAEESLLGIEPPHLGENVGCQPFWRDGSNESVKAKMYEYISCIMEPWDGPALMAFCDGN